MNYSMDWEKEKSAQRIINIYSVAWNGTDNKYLSFPEEGKIHIG